MNRRDALKNISLAFGYSIATPTLISIINACSHQQNINWTPEFLNQEQIHIVHYLTKIIIPKSEITNEFDINLPQFIDKMMAKTTSKEQQIIFINGTNTYINSFKNICNKNILEGTKKDFEKTLDTYFNLPEEQQKLIFDLLELPLTEIPESKKQTYLTYKFLTSVRYYSLFGYYTSESVATHNS